MDVAWTRGKSEEEKRLYIESLKRAKWVFDDLQKLVNANLASLEVGEISPKSYDNPNWAYKQAHVNGYRQALQDVSKLLTI